jgi:hypothetical protein
LKLDQEKSLIEQANKFSDSDDEKSEFLATESVRREMKSLASMTTLECRDLLPKFVGERIFDSGVAK